MSQLGQARIGHKAPDFHCEAVISGAIQEVSLSTFLRPSTSSSSPDSDAPWLLLLFIPAAFSFVCPTEVIAFQNCFDEFRDRNCKIAFISVDTKHSLWHWQNVPRQYGGLGNTDIPLLSDATHTIGRDYGVLIEEEGVCLRGMFIIDNEGVVQQITLNNLTVGRSVLEALRLLEAFQAVAKHGVLCPIDWKPNSHASGALNTISDTLVESYEDRLANLQREFGDVQVTDLDAKHEAEANIPHAEYTETAGLSVKLTPPELPENLRNESDDTRDPPPSPSHTICESRVATPPIADSSAQAFVTPKGSRPPSPITAVASPATTPSTLNVPSPKLRTLERTARHSRGTIHREISDIFSSTGGSSDQFLARSSSSSSSSASSFELTPASGHHSTHRQQHSAKPNQPIRTTQIGDIGASPHIYESERGSHILLEFADPTSSFSTKDQPTHPRALQAASSPSPQHQQLPSRIPSVRRMSEPPAPPLSRATSWSGMLRRNGSSVSTNPATPAFTPPLHIDGRITPGGGQTRLQATFQAIKKMSSGLASPRLDYSPSRQADGGVRDPGYFAVETAEEEEADGGE